LFRAVVVLSAVLALLGIGMATAGAADPGPRFFCFAENGAVCDQTAKNAATLDTTAGGDAGLYLKGNRFSGRALSDVDFSFDYDGDLAGGAPRLSIPIDENGDGGVEAYAFIDANSCGGATSGTVSTALSNCVVYYGSGSYANWDAFAAANPDYTIAERVPFVIADAPVVVDISNVDFSH
jgi:hypothetical protein